ncbi:CDP-alcohol phosphatidyltransferase family protein [Paremcibacter congregatus]|uniref:CDP-diacylglycerol--serine O-phosphatidyltransferase n=1 Tax=Paremcibacter congregatus TaxID=2043170 RepID=A0A2G4YU31_9PROT|nr:CDP-alcohol phosphatidyltransferase family protein [Paremcibacter congregatus]PHZ85803.1 CDP-diacylglycerol--serine O-phosphatidyltransferase [Paremcibacter congregatus]QDE26766.1 CDP-alcohol phosphatidyltransferase family protein [Paremcibacter congregatus]
MSEDAKPESVKRTIEIEEFTNVYLIHPVSSWLVPRLAARNITPNMVSLTGMLFGFLSGVAYHYYQNPMMAILGFVCMAIWHIMDGTDGQLARLTKTQSEFGKVLDGVCDYVTFISVYVGIALSLAIEINPNIWYVVVGAGLLHAIQSGAYELQRSEYDHWGHGKASAALPEIDEMIKDLDGKSILSYIFSQFHIGYVRMQRRFSGVDQRFQTALYDLLAENNDKQDAIRELYREIFAPGIKGWSIMCANYRSIAIFIACISGQPLYYFWYEIAVLTPILIYLVQKQRLLNQLFLLRVKEIL